MLRGGGGIGEYPAEAGAGLRGDRWVGEGELARPPVPDTGDPRQVAAADSAGDHPVFHGHGEGEFRTELGGVVPVNLNRGVDQVPLHGVRVLVFGVK